MAAEKVISHAQSSFGYLEPKLEVSPRAHHLPVWHAHSTPLSTCQSRALGGSCDKKFSVDILCSSKRFSNISKPVNSIRLFY
jgi:hypothetical protein